MLQTVKTFLDIFWTVFKIPLFLFGVISLLIGFLIVFNFIVLYLKGYRIKKGIRSKRIKKKLIRELFINFPRRMCLDIIDREPDFFRYQGLHLFCGEQGSGKTIALVEFMLRMQKEYPLCKTMTNFAYVKEDVVLKDWRQLINFKNGHRGVVVGIDELQNWFSSNDSRNFPVEMLEVVTQNRKNRRVILGTSQVFTRLAKPLREQATLVYLPITLFGCLTIVRVKKPVLTSDGELKEYKNRGWYWFVHSDEIRNAYDTYKVIERLGRTGFSEQKVVNMVNNNYVVTSDEKGKK